MNYDQFLNQKQLIHCSDGIEPVEPHLILFPFQRDIVMWALRRGRACIWADCGLGKTFMQLEWIKQPPGDGLIVAPLNVAQQTIAEAKKIDLEVRYCRHDSECQPGISITNYERLENFNPEKFNKVVLDESGILKAFDGKTRNQIISQFRDTQFKLACTATPAPNDHMELGNHAEFVGAMTRSEMLSMFFVHDGGETSKWRLKGHAESEFWKWMCSWAVMLRKPSDLGYDDDGFDLPPLNMTEHIVESSNPIDGYLLPLPASTLQERRIARKNSIGERVEIAAELSRSNSEQWVFWVNLNAESSAVTKRIGASEITGSTDLDEREEIVRGFLDGSIRHVVTKPSLWGYGLNLQCCHNTALVGISDSYEEFYQLLRRFWRFGQKSPVNAHIIISDQEGAVLRNIKRKESDATRMAEEMVDHMHEINTENLKSTQRSITEYSGEDKTTGKGWVMHHADCVEALKSMPNDSIGLSIFSPPFLSLFTYSNSPRDLANAKTESEFYEHFTFAIKELFRITNPGRICAFHCMNVPAMKERDGYIGLKDFRGELIRMFIGAGFIFHSEHCIWKDPLIEATRTKALGLMHKQLCKDSAMARAGIPDYLIAMRKPGVNVNPVAHEDGLAWFIGENPPAKGVMSHEIWRRYASPVWMDIRQTRTLQKDSAREEKDERHICPLQLDVIERAIELWSNLGDVVLDPFAGIGSTGYVAILANRRFVGIELKQSYYKQAVGNLKSAENNSHQSSLFDHSDSAPEEPVQELASRDKCHLSTSAQQRCGNQDKAI